MGAPGKAADQAAVTVSGEMDCGVVIDGVVHRRFTLRAATLADVYRAAETVAVPEAMQAEQSARIAYQIAVDDAQVLGQLVALGELDPVPSPAALAAEIEPDDMALLRIAAAEVKKKLRASRASLPSTAASKRPSSASALA